MAQEFDRYAREYEELLKDPIRDRFSQDATFFAERKWILIQSYFASKKRALSKMSWLDVGCGKGDLLRQGRTAFAAVAGCDVSTEMLEYCEDVSLRPMTDAGRLPFDDESFDFLTAVCVYHHVPPVERAQLTKESYRVLKTGGVFSIIEHNPFNPATRLIVSRTSVDQNAILLRPSETSRRLREAGFTGIETSYFLYFPEKLFRMLPRMEAALERIPLGGQYAAFGCKPGCEK